MATMATYVCLLILTPLFILCSHFHHSRCRHPPSKSRKLLESPTSSLFVPAPGDNRESTTFPSFQEPLLPPSPVANYLLPNLPFPKIPSFPTAPDSLPGVPVTPLFPSLPLPFPLPLPLPPWLLNPAKPLFPGHSKNNEQKKVDMVHA